MTKASPVERLHFLALFLVSTALIGYELAVMRLFSVGSWSNFGAMVISIALLGFGLAGTLLTFVQESIRRAPDRWLAATGLGLVPLMALSHVLAQYVPFNPVMIVSDSRQILWIGAYYLIYAVPFFVGALFINATFVAYSDRVHRLYFWNMAGSGAGGLFVLVFMYLVPPARLTIPLMVLAAVGGLLCLVEAEGGRIRLQAERLIMTFGVTLISAGLVLTLGDLRVSEFKGISYARSFPDSELEHHSFSPMGEMHVYSSSYFHFAPGLSDTAALNLETMPERAYRGLYIDGSGPIGIMRELEAAEKRYIDFLPMSAPYLLMDEPRVLLVGLGGGISAFTALYHGSPDVTVVEKNPALVRLLGSEPGTVAFNGGLLEDPRINVHEAEPRAYTTRTDRDYDLVEISLIDSVGLSQAGGYSVDANYIYTREAMTDYMESLSPDGILSITVWNKLNPPRNVPKLFSTVVASLREQGVQEPGKRIFSFHLLLSTATILVKNSDFTEEEVRRLEEFARRMSFDVVHSPSRTEDTSDLAGMLQAYRELYTLAGQTATGGGEAGPAVEGRDGANLAQEVPEGARSGSPVPSMGRFYRKAFTWLTSEREGELWKDYLFNIRPATDSRPYYTAYLKLPTLGLFLDQLGSISEEWGYLLLLGTLLQALLFGFLIILIPLLGRWKELFRGRRGTLGIIAYYAALGLAYMLVQIFLIQRLSYFVGDAVFSVSIVITSMLILSGLGSLYASSRFEANRRRGVRVAALGIGGSLLSYIFLLSPVIDALIGMPLPVKALLAIVFVAPAAFFMGMPFPTGLAALGAGRRGLIPWALGMNGALSVAGSVTAKLVAISYGFPLVLTIALLLYGVVGLVYPANEAA